MPRETLTMIGLAAGLVLIGIVACVVEIVLTRRARRQQIDPLPPLIDAADKQIPSIRIKGRP